MARRAVLGAVVLTAAAIYTVVFIVTQSLRVVSAMEHFLHPQDADAGARARPDGAIPPGVHAWPSSASAPGALARPSGRSTAPGGRARVSLRREREHGRVMIPLRSLAQPGSSSTPGVRGRPGGASTTAGGRARPEGASLRQAHEHGQVSHAQLGSSSTPGVRGRPGGASTTAGGRARPEGASAHEHVRVMLPLLSNVQPGGSSTPDARERSDGPSPCNGSAPQAKGALEYHDHHHYHCHCHNYPAVAPPPPPQAATPPTLSMANKTNERSTINRSMLVIGCLYSLLSFCSPMIILWSTGRSVAATDAFYGWLDLIASALSSLGWLLFALSQLHGEDGKIIGTTGVVVNAIGFAFYALYLVAKLSLAGFMRTRDCIWVLLSFFGSYVAVVLVTVYGPLQRESKIAQIISVVAFVLQILSQLLPLLTVLPLLWSMVHPPQIAQRPEHINSRKLTVFSRVASFGLSLFWVSYCGMTYEHDLFQLANDVGAAMSFLSMILHLIYTLRPHDLDYPPDP